jgi:hypothetical protein
MLFNMVKPKFEIVTHLLILVACLSALQQCYGTVKCYVYQQTGSTSTGTSQTRTMATNTMQDDQYPRNIDILKGRKRPSNVVG